MKSVLAKMAIAIAIIIIVGIGYGLWYVTGRVPFWSLQAWAILGTLLIPPGYFLGFWMGKTEVRGFLSGADMAMDRLGGVVMHTLNTARTSHQASVAMTHATAGAMYNGNLPLTGTAPRITSRSTETGEPPNLEF